MVCDRFVRECSACHKYNGEISSWPSLSRAFLSRFACSFLPQKSLNETRRLLDFHPGAGMLPSLTVTRLPGSLQALSRCSMQKPAHSLELCTVCSL